MRSAITISSNAHATVVQLVVRHLAKVEVAGSSPVCRSSKKTVYNRMHALRAFYCHEQAVSEDSVAAYFSHFPSVTTFRKSYSIFPLISAHAFLCIPSLRQVHANTNLVLPPTLTTNYRNARIIWHKA